MRTSILAVFLFLLSSTADAVLCPLADLGTGTILPGNIWVDANTPGSNSQTNADTMCGLIKARINLSKPGLPGQLIILSTENCDLQAHMNDGGRVGMHISELQFSSCGQITAIVPPGGGSGCMKSNNKRVTVGQAMVLGLDGPENGIVYACPSVLQRTDFSESGMPLVLDDWTVFSSNGRSITALATSSPGHSDAVAECLSSANSNQFLVVNRWEHPETHPMFMPRPEAGFTDSIALSNILRRLDEGRIVFRVEIGESESVRKVEVLHSTVRVPNGLVQSLRQKFFVNYEDDRRHRFSYYAIYETGNGRGDLIDSFIALPQCGCP